MKIQSFIYPSVLILFIFIGACVSNENENLDLGNDQAFFPLTIGKYREYQVDSILYRQGRFLDSVRSYVREEITGSYKDTIGTLFIILRSVRKKTTDPWLASASYTARVDPYRVVYNQDNLNFIPLVFPLKAGTNWDGLALIQTDQTFNVNGESIEIYQNWDPFKIEDEIKAEKIGALNFIEVVTVLQTDEDDILSKRYSIEKYAKGVGLVYKEMTVLDCNNTVNQCSTSVPWDKRATKGFILRQTITKNN
ncbi:MAG: hypothetical protein ABI761_20120 [Saprospiraceae bacterium]